MADARRLYLIDGTSQLFRAYFAIRGLTNREGLPTNAVFGFTNMLRKLLEDEKPEHIAVAFDLEGPTFRHDRYAEYKANRPDTPHDLNIQVPYVKQVCEGFRIPILELEGYEADDLIATYARLAREAGYEVVIVASDKDLLQLVGDGVIVLNPSKNLKLDAAAVKEHFGVLPDHVRDVLGLMGDAVDNIPGVPGIGEKTAVEIVSSYGDVEAVLARASLFVEAWAARDALVNRLEGEESLDDGLAIFTDRLSALIDVEADGPFRERLNATRELTKVAAVAPLDGKEKKRLAKTLKELDKGSSRKVWTALSEHADDARLSRELATVDRSVPVTFDAEALRLDSPDRDMLATLFRAMGFRTLTAEFSGDVDVPVKPAKEEQPLPSQLAPKSDRPSAYRTVWTRSDLEDLAVACRRAGRMALDTETNGTDPMRARLVGISAAVRAGEGFYVPIGHDYMGAPEQPDITLVREVLGPVLADPAIRKVAQNLKFDDHVLRRHGLPVAGWELDTMVAAFLLEPDRTTYNLDGLAAQILGHETIKYESLVGSGARQATLNLVDVDRVTAYAAEDAEVTLRLADVLAPRLEQAGVGEIWRTMDGPLLPVLGRMEAAGIRIDTVALRQMAEEMERVLDGQRRKLHELAGSPFNVDSPKQLREILFGKLGLTPRRKTVKSRVHSTDAQTLELLAEDHAIAKTLLEYREIAKLKGTYVETLPLLVNPETGRVHTSFHPTGAATGRLSSSDPNLQNIPARTAIGLGIRAAFIPEEGSLFLASDYSQIELRVLAHVSEDPALVEAFHSGEDVHRVTAAKVFGVLPQLVDDTMRRRAKAVNFGILYGMSESRLARDQGMSRNEAKEFIAAYFERFRGVKTYIDRTRGDAMRDGAVRTLFGRARYFTALKGRGGRAEVEQALRAAVNTTIQGTAADLMKMAMLRVDRELLSGGFRARMLLQVHDELLLEVPIDEMDRVRALVRREMEQVHPLRVPLVADQKTGADWREVT